MKRLVPPPLLLSAILLMALFAFGHAQERRNFLAINGEIVEPAGPFYFVAQGESGTAFVDADAFANAVGLRLHRDPDRGTLRLEAGARWVTIEATSDVANGLQAREGAIVHPGGALAGPRAIVVAGVTYLPIARVVEALDGATNWYPDARVVTVDLPEPIGGYAVGQLRTGQHDGYSRVAIDLPDGLATTFLVDGDRLLLLLPNAVAPDAPARSFANDPHLAAAGFETVAGKLALAVTPRQPIGADPRMGFRVGTNRTDAGLTWFVDVGPEVRSEGEDDLDAVGADTVPAAAVAQAQPRRLIVVLDPGHGGKDPGAVAPWGDEKDVVLDVALAVEARLQAAGVEVVMTRRDDRFLELRDRSTYARNDRNLFVSIHANGSNSSMANGIETFVFGRPLDPKQIERAIAENGGGAEGAALTAEAERLAAELVGEILAKNTLDRSNDLANLMQSRLVSATNAVDRGVKPNLFYVIRNTPIPAILVELGFMTHPTEGRRLTDPAYQATLADAVAGAILGFLDVGGSVAERR